MEKEEDVTGPALCQLRARQGKSLKDFWGEVLVKPSTGAYYEIERSPLPDPVRRLCYLHFVCGLNINMADPKRAAELLDQAARCLQGATEIMTKQGN